VGGGRGKYGKYNNKIGGSPLKHVVYLLEYRTRISPLKSTYKKWGGLPYSCPQGSTYFVNRRDVFVSAAAGLMKATA